MSEYPFSRFQDYLRFLIPIGMKAGLQNIQKICENLGNPQNQFKSIHVAGSNGKGSTSFHLAGLLQKEGLKTGLFTSPHLVSVRERFRINDSLIPQAQADRYAKAVFEAASGTTVTFFELLTAMCFLYFAEEKVDVAVLEVGLGGRLDSTSIAPGSLTLLSGISLEHTDILGETESKILVEKLGVWKRGTPLIYGELKPHLETELISYCNQNVPTIRKVEWEKNTESESLSFHVLKGAYSDYYFPKAMIEPEYMFKNRGLALLGAETFLERALKLESYQMTWFSRQWPCRLQVLECPNLPRIILDGSHNSEGISTSIESLKVCGKLKEIKTVIYGSNQDKDLSSIVKDLQNLKIRVILVQSSHAKSHSTAYLKTLFSKDTEVFESTLTEAIRQAGEKGTFWITGSLFVAGDAIQILKKDYQALKEFRGLTQDMNEVR